MIISQKFRDISICHKGGSKFCYEAMIMSAMDEDYTAEDCNLMKQKCGNCAGSLFYDCMIVTLARNPSFSEGDCDVIEDETFKEKCVRISYQR